MKISQLAAVTAAALLSLAAVSAQAQASKTPAPAAAAQAATPPATQTASRPASNSQGSEQVICRHEEEETGSRLGGHKTCHTRAQWDSMARDGGDLLNSVQNTGSALPATARH